MKLPRYLQKQTRFATHARDLVSVPPVDIRAGVLSLALGAHEIVRHLGRREVHHPHEYVPPALPQACHPARPPVGLVVRNDVDDRALHPGGRNRAQLQDANLSGAWLQDAKLGGADLQGAALYGAFFCRTVMPDGSIKEPECEVEKSASGD